MALNLKSLEILSREPKTPDEREDLVRRIRDYLASLHILPPSTPGLSKAVELLQTRLESLTKDEK